MSDVKSCGIIVFKRDPLEFLLMRHPTRWDLPKGHVDPGETDLECALRELEEETGIGVDASNSTQHSASNITIPSATAVILIASQTRHC